MINEFNEMPWHDAVLKNISISRNEDEALTIMIEWPEAYESKLCSIEFVKCYGFYAKMHFGIVPPDSILEAECIVDSAELNDFKIKWKKMGVDLSNLYCFQIITNSTNSVINIFSLGYRLIYHN